MNDKLAFSKYLSAVLHDWQTSRAKFPCNTSPRNQWPIPFFGNPRRAVVATVGVNPSSGEFRPDRNWNTVHTPADWKRRLKDYFNHNTSAHEWFEPWRTGLEFLGVNYQDGTAAHFDVSYRSTTAMLRNADTNHAEFRRMVERDAAWFFRLLPLCERLRVLLTFGPIVRADGSTERLAAFLRKQAARHGFKVLPGGGLRVAAPDATGRSFFVHEVRASGRGTITEQVVENLRVHQDGLRGQIEAGA